MKCLRRLRSGQIVVLTTLAIVAIIGFVALAVDIGFAYSARRRMQTAADAAAVAGATALRDGQSVTAAAKSLSSIDGFTDGKSNVTVTVNNPPAGGIYVGNSSYVEVIVKQPTPTYFLKVLGYSSLDVSTRAVSGAVSGPTCIYALDSGAPQSFYVQNQASLSSSCGVQVNSSSQNALAVDPPAGILSTPSVGVVGGYTGKITSPNVRTGVAPLSDPLAYVPSPTPGTCISSYPTGFTAGSGTWTLNPGTYCGGITLTGTASVTLNPGTYILMGGGLNVADNATLTGSGVTLYNTGTPLTYQPFNLTGNATENLSAPTSGPLAGILLFQDRSIPDGRTNVFTSTSGNFEGAMYIRTGTIELDQPVASRAAYTVMVANKIVVETHPTVVNSNYSSLANGSPIKSSVLYE